MKVHKTLIHQITFSLLALVGLFSGSVAQAALIIDSPFSGGGSGDQLFRGFYVENFGGNTIDTVTLRYTTSVAGTYDTMLTVRLDSYDGILVGSQSISTLLSGGSTEVIYDFGDVNVGIGSLLTFTQEVLGGPSSTVFYDTGANAHSQITQTNGTSAPLDNFRRAQVGVKITGSVSIPAPASMLLLALGLVLLRLRSHAR